MKIYTLHKSQQLPIGTEDAWAFFSDPSNLGRITPEHMNFKIIYNSGKDKMYAGQIIRYAVNVLPIIRLKWTTEITHVSEPEYFVDEQRFGPYTFWHHQHRFEVNEGGVLMTDIVNYAIPIGLLGRLAHLLFVGREVKKIFEYREQMLQRLFLENRKV